jgi:transcriptional regulator GlxA family with amidase domain
VSQTAAERINQKVVSRGIGANLADQRKSEFQPESDLLMMLKDAARLLSLDARLAEEQISEAIVFLESRESTQDSQTAEVFVSGGLLPWQIRRLREQIDKSLDARLTTAELARTVKLSTGYFCHAFKRSFGVPPHAYISGARIKRAQGMMLATSEPLSQIAVACGLGDQSHLSRLFRKIVGQSPNSWRRANKEGPTSLSGESLVSAKVSPSIEERRRLQA